MADTVSDAVVAVDVSGRVAWLNPAAERLFERSSADVEGSQVHDLGVPDEAVAVEHGDAGGYLLVLRLTGGSSRALRDVAHELSNVFAVVSTYTSLVLRHVETATASGADADWSAVRRDLETVADAAAEGAALCNELVAIGRGDTGRPPDDGA